eukprot:gene41460-56092_t
MFSRQREFGIVGVDCIIQKLSYQRTCVQSLLPAKQSTHVIYQRTVSSRKLSGNDVSIETRSEPPRLEYSLVWIGLLVYAFALAPGGSPEAATIDASLVEKLIFTPYDGTTNPILVAIFNFLGILPAVYASLLLPGSKKQPIPALPFVLGSFALGFFGIGPYLGARTLQFNVLEQDKGRGSVLFESKLSAVLLLGFGSFLTYYMLSNSVGDFGTVWSEYIDLFKTQRLVHVSTIDFSILSLAVWDPMREDLARRSKDVSQLKGIPFGAFCFPIFADYNGHLGRFT